MDTIQAHVFIVGTVQGVGYRYATHKVATDLGLTGWVRNRQDGRVEAVFEGDRPVVEQMIQWCHQGPPAATVTDVSVAYTSSQGLQSFEMRRTL